MSNSTLSDHDLLTAFEACALDDFRHPDHVRVAWIYLTRLPFPEASRKMAESVRRFAAAKGATEKYHETITQAWMRLVAAAMERDGDSRGTIGRGGPSRPSRGSTVKVLPYPGRRDTAMRGPRDNSADSPLADFNSFAAAHPELLDSRLLDEFYSRELLSTPTARTAFVPPDLCPLP